MSNPSPPPRPGGTPPVKKPVPWRLYTGIVVGVLAVVIILQNTAPATFKVFAWSFETPTWVMLAIALALGFVLGWLLHYRRRTNKRR
jgi:uncharacterized integral membrane protein